MLDVLTPEIDPAEIISDAPVLHIVGPFNIHNGLMVSYLEKELALTCTVSTSLLQMPLLPCRPDSRQLVLLDFRSDDATGLLDGSPPQVNVDMESCLIALSNTVVGRGTGKRALEIGMCGIFYENDSLAILSKGVTAILNGDLWFPRRILTQFILEKPTPTPHGPNSVKILTDREMEILRKIADGEGNKEIADSLNISPHTVKTHIYNIYQKIGVSNRMQATHWSAKYL